MVYVTRDRSEIKRLSLCTDQKSENHAEHNVKISCQPLAGLFRLNKVTKDNFSRENAAASDIWNVR